MSIYKVTLKFDGGTVSVITAATSRERAMIIVCAAECAPLSAIVSVEKMQRV